jgi:hypothetical protein
MERRKFLHLCRLVRNEHTWHGDINGDPWILKFYFISRVFSNQSPEKLLQNIFKIPCGCSHNSGNSSSSSCKMFEVCGRCRIRQKLQLYAPCSSSTSLSLQGIVGKKTFPKPFKFPVGSSFRMG